MSVVFVSQNDDPYWNLAVEDWLFRHSELASPILFLWQSRPCVVVGRFQNPWRECDVPRLENEGVLFVRRQSGGGTVVHDLGNINFTFISKRADYCKKKHLRIIQERLKVSFGIPVEVNDRHDLTLEGKKISGSAFKENRDRCFHHGTLLVSSDLMRLKGLLAGAISNLRTKAIASVPSPVTNLNSFTPIGVKDVLVSLSEGREERLFFDEEVVEKKRREYSSSKWLWSETPDFWLPAGAKETLIHKHKWSEGDFAGQEFSWQTYQQWRQD
jgi:lipoyltransferase/lipoate-protein ligase